jgi:hypothetical protein
MKRVKIWGTTPEGHIIEAHMSEQIQGVLYVNGEKGEEKEVWLYHHAHLKNGKGKDSITIHYQERHNEKTEKGITTKTEEKKLEIPVEYKLTVKSIGEQQFVIHRTGRVIKVKEHHIVHGEKLTDDIWNSLTEEQQKHLEAIDIWEAWEELKKYLSSTEKKDKQTATYEGALQQIYNHGNPFKYEHTEPEIEKIPTHKVVKADITLVIQAGKYGEEKHFTEGSIFECNGEIKRSFAIVLPRIKIFQANLPGEYKIISDTKRKIRRR